MILILVLEIGIRIQDIRESRHMKAIEFGKLSLALVKTRCLELKVEKANCTIPQLYCIAQILDCSADFLLFWRRTHELFAGDGGISKQFKNGDWKNRGRN